MRLVRHAALSAALLGSAACGQALGLGDLIYDVDTNANVGGGGGGPGSGGSQGVGASSSNGGNGGSTTTVGPGGSGGDAGSGGSGGSPPLDCPSAPGPTMVDMGSFCIDSTAVSNADYGQFIAALVPPQSTSNDPAYCSWNTSYLQIAWPPPAAQMNWPVGDVDWCDAYAYCKWAGKRLCGAISDGGMLPYGDFANPSLSEFHYVCTQGGTTAYPYGSTADATACNTSEGGMGIVDVGSVATCTGTTPPFDQVFDMSGGMHEWTNECDGQTGGADNCRLRTGSAFHNVTDSSCTVSDGAERNVYYGDAGFRCCADSPP